METSESLKECPKLEACKGTFDVNPQQGQTGVTSTKLAFELQTNGSPRQDSCFASSTVGCQAAKDVWKDSRASVLSHSLEDISSVHAGVDLTHNFSDMAHGSAGQEMGKDGWEYERAYLMERQHTMERELAIMKSKLEQFQSETGICEQECAQAASQGQPHAKVTSRTRIGDGGVWSSSVGCCQFSWHICGSTCRNKNFASVFYVEIHGEYCLCLLAHFFHDLFNSLNQFRNTNLGHLNTFISKSAWKNGSIVALWLRAARCASTINF